VSRVLDQVWRWLALAATVGDFSSGARLGTLQIRTYLLSLRYLWR
jgi:hypothetical protein